MKKLYRAKSSTIAGVCKGLGGYFNIDDSLIRILFVILVFTPFPIILTYLLLWVSFPKETL
jgi:phage shock protein PspC (stress-responsive transcriptional regulator)